MKRSLILLLPLLIMTGCITENSFTVKGIIHGRKEKTIYLSKLDIGTPVLIDSARIGKNGKFRLRVKTGGPEFYQLGYSEADFITILAEGGEKIHLEFPSDNLHQDYNISGSEGSEQVRMLDMRLAAAQVRLDSLRRIWDQASVEPGFEEMAPLLETEYTTIVRDLRKKNIEFIITNITSLASIKALYQMIDENTYVLYEPRDLQYLKIVSDSLTRYYPKSRYVQALVQDMKKEMGEFYRRQVEALAENAPGIVLDPFLKNINGQRVALSSLRGRVVLLSFWSARSKDCITDNLQLKEFYRAYNRRGFEIYQINLDENEEDWRAAVRFDDLPWINTREDDPANPKNAMIYNVKSLPANYLYNRDGEIIATNIHGRSLQIKLNQLLNN